MSLADNCYKPFIHLSTAVTRSGTEMIEQIGQLTAIQRFRRHGDYHPADEKVLREADLKDLREAIKRASDALRNYDTLIAAGVTEATAEQFDDAAETLSA